MPLNFTEINILNRFIFGLQSLHFIIRWYIVKNKNKITQTFILIFPGFVIINKTLLNLFASSKSF